MVKGLSLLPPRGLKMRTGHFMFPAEAHFLARPGKAEKRASQEPLRNLRLHTNSRGHQTGRPSESEPRERTRGNAWCRSSRQSPPCGQLPAGQGKERHSQQPSVGTGAGEPAGCSGGGGWSCPPPSAAGTHGKLSLLAKKAAAGALPRNRLPRAGAPLVLSR